MRVAVTVIIEIDPEMLREHLQDELTFPVGEAGALEAIASYVQATIQSNFEYDGFGDIAGETEVKEV